MMKYLDWIKNKTGNKHISNIKEEQKDILSKKQENTIYNNKDNIFSDHIDELLWDAGNLIIKNQRASIGMLQRYFKIGFNRAIRIMDELHDIGVVGEEIGTSPRRVLMSLEEFSVLYSTLKTNMRNPRNIDNKQFVRSERIDMYNNKYDYMTGEDFEVFVAQILKKIGFVNIEFTKGSGDQGVDIIAERDNIKYAIQCKRYSQSVGNKAVQEVFAGKTFYHCHVGVVVTNSYFTQSAKELAKANGIVLWDRDFLNKNIDTEFTNIIDEKNDSDSIDSDSIIEKIYYINEDFTVFKLKKDNTIEILGICKNSINAANLYCTLSIEFKDNLLGKFNFAIAINYGNLMAVYTNKDGVEFFGGKNENDEIEIGIPCWMDKARDKFLKYLNENEKMGRSMIDEAKNCLEEFVKR